MNQSDLKGSTKANGIAGAAATSLALALVSISSPTAAQAAETKRGPDYVALLIEAEADDSRDERWVLTDPSTPTQENDPDPNHTDGASGGKYLELLPDIRVKHGDPFGPPTGFWPQPGTGPEASYSVDFPEPGRYHVHARIFATGSEDNGIHFGLDGEWPDSAKALQTCTAGARAWRWSSRRRHIGGWPCGVEKSIWLEVDSAGPHTVVLSAREDGFELDKIMLIKDLSDGTRTCEPATNSANDIVCRDGGIEVSDEKVDLDIELGFYVETEIEVENEETGEPETETEITLEEEPAAPLAVGDTVEIGVRVKNRDIYDDATGTVVEFELAASDWKRVGSSRNCSRDGDTVACPVGKVRPTGVNDGTIVYLTLEALGGGLLPIGASVFAEQEDEEADDNAERMNVEVGSDVEPTELAVEVASRRTGARLAGEESATVDATVRNTGDTEASDVTLTFELADGLALDDVPASCELTAADALVTCDVGGLAADDSQRVSIGVAAEESGTYSVEARVSGANADEAEARFLLEFVGGAGDDGSDDAADGGDGSGSDSGGGVSGGATGTDSAGEDGAGNESSGDGTSDGEEGGSTGGDVTGGKTNGTSGDAEDGASDGEAAAGSDAETPETEPASGKSGGGGAGRLGLLALALLATFRRRLVG